MKRIFAAAVAASLMLAAGCTTVPVQNVKDAPVASAAGHKLTAAQVRGAIITAGASLGWKFVDRGPGKLEGTLKLRDHTAIVDVPYSATSYSILFKGGENLNQSGDTIHKNYNGWVSNLDRAIRGAVSAL